MEFSFVFLLIFVALTPTQAQNEPQIAPQSSQQAPPGRAAPLIGVRFSAATDVSHVSFNSPLVSYGNSLNEIQLPAAPIQPANLKQAPQEINAESEDQDNQLQTRAQAQQIEPLKQVTQAIQSEPNPNQQQFISIQQYPGRPQLKSTPQGFSLSQNLPGPQPQAAVRYAPQYPTIQSQPQVQQPQQYAAAPQPQQYNVAQPQQYVLPQQQYSSSAPVNYAPQQQQAPSPVAYSSPSSNTYFATGPFATQYSNAPLQPLAPQYPQPIAQPQYIQRVAAQYAQPVPTQYTPQVPAQYAQPVTSLAPQQVAQTPLPASYSGAPAQLVSRVSFNGPVSSFSYGF